MTDPLSGRTTGLARTVRRALKALSGARVPYAVIGAAALAARGLPRMTRDLDVVVLVDDGARAIEALRAAGLRSATPTGPADAPEPMIVFLDPTTKVQVDLLVAAGDPEATVIDQARPARLFGVRPPVASLEHLLLLYLYSNQPKHLGDFAAIVASGRADLVRAERLLAEMHPAMLSTWKRRVRSALTPPPAPARPRPAAGRRRAVRR
ncbi:MAG TPA: hypothetical protein VG389_11485 [Myxococcota bacterium]|nr:hypothetical protein [Myxococcota bacterium]